MAQTQAFSSNPEEEHRHGDAYGRDKQVPTTQKFDENERRKREEADKQLKEAKRKGLARVVRDPVTGGSVQVKDSSGDYRDATTNMYISVPRRNVVSPHNDAEIRETSFNCEGIKLAELKSQSNRNHVEKAFGHFLSRHDSASRKSPSSTSNGKSRRENSKEKERGDSKQTNAHDEDGWVDIPMRGQRTNIMFYTLPDPDFDAHHQTVTSWFMRLPIFIFISELARYLVFDFGRLIAIVLYFCVGYWIREQMNTSWTATKLDTVKRRADQALAKRVPESAEWLNSLVTAIWKQLNPSIFDAAVDKLEEIMQASAPRIVHAVKVADLGHGDHPFRVLNMRYLDEKEINEDQKNSSDDQHPGNFVNMEVTVAYAAKQSGSEAALKVKNVHILIIFYTGLANVLAVPLPVWVEIEGFIVTMRLRMQFTPEFPFIQNTTFSLMGLPKFDISVVPINRKLASISNLPIISHFITKSINAACNEYVAPKSYTIDVGQIIAGEDYAKETVAIGVIIVHIDRAEGLQPQDSNGLSDPYIVVAMSRYGRPIYSTRIIEKTLNPIFRETCFVLITPEALRSKERLSIQLWDSDRIKADDENGRVEFDLQDLIRDGGKINSRQDSLVSSLEGRPMPGTLHWSIGYFSKRQCNVELATDGSDDHLASDIKDHPDLHYRRNLPDLKTASKLAYCPPDPVFPSGILHISKILNPMTILKSLTEIHQAVDLYADSPKGSWKPNMHYRQGQDTTSPEIEEDEERSPSAYCNILLNDQLIYKTRTKPFSSRPFFNAGTERFVRDWRTAACAVAVRDSRTREHDALLGVIPLKLAEVFKNASMVVKNYPLLGGSGEGKVRVSMLWESVDHKLAEDQLGWDTGNFRVLSDYTAVDLTGEGHSLKHMKLKIHTSLASANISGSKCQSTAGSLIWSVDKREQESMEIPAFHRHSSAFCIEFHSQTRRNCYAIAIIWLEDVLDNKKTKFKIPIWRIDSDQKRYQISQNKVATSDDLQGCQKIGTLQFDAIFLRGLGPGHGRALRSDVSLRQVHEVWAAIVAYGERDRKGAYMVKSQKRDEPTRPEDTRNANRRPNESETVSGDGDCVHEDARDIARDSAGHAYSMTKETDDIIDDGSYEQYSSPLVNGQDSEQVKPSSDTHHTKPLQSRSSEVTDVWSFDKSLGPEINEQDTIRDKRGSVLLPKQGYQTDFLDATNSSGDEHESIAAHHSQNSSKRSSYIEKENLHRQQRGSMQFETMRSLKWAKDGAILGTHKLSDKFRRQPRIPDHQPGI